MTIERFCGEAVAAERSGASGRTGRVALAALLGLSLALLPSAAAHANCNLIPSAVTELGSTLGKVDRPIASPGQRVTVSLDFACNPSAPGFSPQPAENFVRLVFQPPGSAADPSLATELPVTPEAVEECGPSRCANLVFQIPDTDDLLAPSGDGRGLVGPATVIVENGAGTQIATIGPLYQPTLSCGDRTPDPIFEHFLVLPPPNLVPVASSSGQQVSLVTLAAVDAGGDLLVPIDYSNVLPSGNAGPLARILDATWDLPAFEGAPAPIAFPDNGFEWVRSFSDVGRAIPPFLEIDGNGGALSGSVDAAISVLHIQNSDGNQTVFDLAYRLVDGRGPVVINDPVAITIGGAIPLESLTTAAQTVVFVVDEAAQGEDLDGDGLLESQVVQIKDVATGATTDTGAAVTRVSFDDVNKQALANDGNVVAFLQSEAASHDDLRPFGQEQGDGDRLDDALRVYDAQGDRISDDGVTMADALPRVNNRSLAVTDGALVVFGSLEGDESPVTTELVSVATDGSAGTGFDPDLSEDGQEVVFYSGGSSFLPDTAPVYDETTFTGAFDFDGSSGGMSATTRFDFDFDSWPLTLSSVFEVPVDLSLFGNFGSGNTTGQFDFAIGNPATGLSITSGAAAGHYYTCQPGTWPDSCVPFDPDLNQFAIGETMVFEATIPDENVSINTDQIGDLRARKPGNVHSWRVQIIATVVGLDGQSHVEVDVQLRLRAILVLNSQVYLRDRDTDTLELISRSPFGGAGTDYSWRPSVSGDGDVVAYTTAADTLTNQIDDNGVEDVIRWRRSDASSEFVSYNVNQGAPGNGPSNRGVVSGDGSTIVFITQATNLFPGAAPTDVNGAGDDILIYDVASRSIVDRVTGPGGVQPNGPIGLLDVSWDGSVVAFGSYAGNLDPPSGGAAAADVFRFDRNTREIVRVTKAFDGTASDGDSGYGVSLGGDDGRYLALSTDATNLIDDAGLGLPGRHVLVYDHQTGETERVDLTTAGKIGDGGAEDPVLSRDGQRVAFRSDATNLKGGLGGSALQAYLYDRVTDAIDLYSIGSDGEPQGAPGTGEVALSGDGYTVGWNSNDPGLVPDANGDVHDIFVRGVHLAMADDLDGNGHGGDRVLRVFEADEETPGFRSNAQVPFELASVAGGRVAVLSPEAALISAATETTAYAGVAGAISGIIDFGGDDDEGTSLTFPLPALIAAGDIPGGAPGQTGKTRIQAEFDLSAVPLSRLAGATLVWDVQPSVGSASARFLRVTQPVDLAITLGDFGSRVQGIAGAPIIPEGFSGETSVNVTAEVRDVLTRGNGRLALQVRSTNEAAADFTSLFRSSLVNGAFPDGNPTILVETLDVPGANGDTDFDDDVILVYDGAMDALTPLGISGRDVKISDQALCAIVSESDEAQDLTGDGDTDDGVLFVADLSSYPPDPVNTGLDADQIVAAGQRCFFTSPEGPGNDLNGDGDFADHVLRGFDVATGQVIEFISSEDQDGNPLPAPERLSAADFVAAGDWVAFRVCEADQGFRPMNRDGDTSDCVMHLANVVTGELVNTLRAAERCTFDGCDPFFEPYRLRADPGPMGEEVVTLSFVTFEPTQGGETPGEGCLGTSPEPSCDLTTDGDDLDYVVQVVSPQSRQVQVVEVSPETPVAPFPMVSFAKNLLLVQLPCLSLALPGVDCNTTQNVTVVVGDADNDGILDTSLTGGDNCSEFNPNQNDGDADGLGAVCDPDTDPETQLETTTPEQELPGATVCELTGDGVIDQGDVDIIFGDRGQTARPSDPRDADRDGQITVLDARYCVTQCTYPACISSPPAEGSFCGLLGAEALLMLFPWLWIRRRRTR